MPTLTKPTMKQKAFAKAYVKNKFNGKKAVLEVYDVKEGNAKGLAHNTLKNPLVQNAIQEELAKAGLSREYLNKTMYDAIEINKGGKPSQAVLAQLLIQAQRIYSYIPKDNKTVVKETRKVFLDKDYNEVKTQLEATVS